MYQTLKLLLVVGFLFIAVNSEFDNAITQCLLSKLEDQQKVQYQGQGDSYQVVCHNINSFQQLRHVVPTNWKHLKIVNDAQQQFYMDAIADMQLNHLEKLDLSEAGEFVLNKSSFSLFPNLLSLNISGSQLESLNDINFDVKNILEHLDVSWNFLDELNFAPNSKFLHLESANFSHNSIKFVENATGELFPKIKYLLLDNNDVESVNFHNYTNLQVLSLSDNQIEKIKSNTFSVLPSLEKLIITSNPVYSIDERSFESMTALKSLNLSANSLQTISPESFFGLRRLLALDISSNNLETLLEGQFQHLKKLQYLDISRNSLTTLNSLIFRDLPYLRKLFVFENDITEIKPNTFANLNSLDTLDLSNNAIGYIGEDIFGSKMLERFKKLSLKSNNIKALHPMAFASLPFLQYLALGNNEITTLDVRTFARLHHLEKLHLGTNLLESIPLEVLDSLADIAELLIDNNRLTFLPETNVTFNRLRKSSIEGNPWQCPCLGQIVDWFEKRNIDYIRLQSPYYNGKKPLCVVTPTEFCVRDLNTVKKFPIEDIFNGEEEEH